MGASEEMIKVRVRRQDPALEESARFEEYQVPCSRARRVLDVLEYIQEELDPTLAWRPHLCRDSCCSACWLQVDGRKRMACTTVLDETRGPIVLEPLPGYALIRDLVVDYSREMKNDGGGVTHDRS